MAYSYFNNQPFNDITGEKHFCRSQLYFKIKINTIFFAECFTQNDICKLPIALANLTREVSYEVYPYQDWIKTIGWNEAYLINSITLCQSSSPI